ncbi:MAG: hypothetical protein N2235_21700 [Fischerella sp.]|nr:hypothetical protein [Fischerella sp.]
MTTKTDLDSTELAISAKMARWFLKDGHLTLITNNLTTQMAGFLLKQRNRSTHLARNFGI